MSATKYFFDLVSIHWLDAQPNGWASFAASYVNATIGLRQAIADFRKVQHGYIKRGVWGAQYCEWTLAPMREQIRISVRECIDARQRMLDSLAVNPCMNARPIKENA